MSNTSQFGFPLVMPAQAQKHVTVNQALSLLDAVAQMRVASATKLDAPETPQPGQAYILPSDPSGTWSSHAGKLAIWSNGAWTYLPPRSGWRAWVEDENSYRVFTGTDWIADATAIAPGGSAMRMKIDEFDHLLGSGSTSTTVRQIPPMAVVFGVTGRVVEPLDNAGLASWRIGVGSSDNRYGSGIGTALNSLLRGLTGSPVTYYEATPLLLTAEAGVFAGGRVRLAVSYMMLEVPRAV